MTKALSLETRKKLVDKANGALQEYYAKHKLVIHDECKRLAKWVKGKTKLPCYLHFGIFPDCIQPYLIAQLYGEYSCDTQTKFTQLIREGKQKLNLVSELFTWTLTKRPGSKYWAVNGDKK